MPQEILGMRKEQNMKDGQYTVRKVEAGKRKKKVIFEGVTKTDFIWTEDANLQKGSRVKVRGGRIVSVEAYA